ncbi:MAG: hypothetical protein K9I36_07770 [Bacteroidia bacterium]|nr:hypothetical protein [Bacteroidia bacterium]MCF8426614.1 hypothetical protein [Bacteroidia bacterium]
MQDNLDPKAQDNNKEIHFFSSLDEQAEDNYRWLATLTPEQHLQNAVSHIKQIYAEELKQNPDLGKELIFD